MMGFPISGDVVPTEPNRRVGYAIGRASVRDLLPLLCRRLMPRTGYREAASPLRSRLTSCY